VILVMTEVRDGALSASSREVLGMARRIAGMAGGRVAAVLMGAGVSPFAQDLAAWGAETVYVCEDERLAEFQPGLFLKVFQEAAEAAGAKSIKFPPSEQ